MALSDTQKQAIADKLRAGQSGRSLAKEYDCSPNAIRDIKKKIGLSEGGGGGSGGGGSATFDGPLLTSPTAGEGPVPTLSADVMGEMGAFGFWLMGLRYGVGWELDDRERREIGQATAQFLPFLPGWMVERLARGVMFIRPVQVLVKIVKRRMDAIVAYRESAGMVGESRAEEAPPAATVLRVVPEPQSASATPPAAPEDGPDARTREIARGIMAERPGISEPAALAEAALARQAERKADRYVSTQGAGAYSATTLLGKS